MTPADKQTKNDLPTILGRSRVTEKSTDGTTMSPPRYTFAVAPTANKFAVRRAITKQYKVTPTKVAMIVVKGKKVFSRGRSGARPGLKKAIVYLKPGEKIDLA